MESFEDKIESDLKQVMNIINSETVDFEDSSEQTFLYKASEQGEKDVVQFLLNMNANLYLSDRDGISPLMVAARIGHTEVVSVLLDGGAAVNHTKHDGVSALFLALQNGHQEIVKLLIDADADLNSVWKISGAQTPQYQAAILGHSRIIEMLSKAEGS